MDMDYTDENSNSIKFVGAANEEYESFAQLSKSSLDDYCPNWNNYNSPRSHLIPPVFYYKNPDVADDAIRQIPNESLRRPIIDRKSDFAEHLMFKAIEQLARDHDVGPFISIRSLKVDRFIDIAKSWDKKCFDRIPKALLDGFGPCKREYDFILIGPKIGFVVIEAKSPAFKGRENLVNHQPDLPNLYDYGIKQLNTSAVLLQLLQKYVDIKLTSFGVVKILFTPFAERERFDKWLQTLSPSDQQGIVGKMIGIIPMFKEDANSSDDHEPYCSALRGNLEKHCQSISTDDYEKLCPILAGMLSVVKVPKTKILNRLEIKAFPKLDMAQFSERIVLQNESVRISSQNPFHGQNNTKASAVSLLTMAPTIPFEEAAKENTMEVSDQFKVVFLTPDQQTALNGKPRQFILGPAGTGKTIVLQLKALDLLSKKEPVVVFAAESYRMHYEKLFQNRGFDQSSYKTLIWSEAAATIITELNQHLQMVSPKMGTGVKRVIFEFAQELVSNFDNRMAKDCPWLFNDTHLLVDDSFDYDSVHLFGREKHFLAPLLMLATANLLNPKKVVWIAADPHASYGFPMPHNLQQFTNWKGIVIDLLLQNWGQYAMTPAENYYDMAILKQVIRCSESIFNTAYDKTLSWQPQAIPSIAHKIQGFLTLPLYGAYETFVEAKNGLFCRLEYVLRLLHKDISLHKVAIIVSRFSEKYTAVLPFLKRKCPELWSELGSSSLHSQMALHHWYEVSSAEWPVVIFASCFPKHLDPTAKENIRYQRYRALSRAIAKLIDINVTYNGFEEPDNDEDTQNEWTVVLH